MKELIRTKVDKFDIENSLSFEKLEKNLINIEDVFNNFKNVYLSERKKELFLNGVNLRGFEKFEDGTYKIYCNRFIGLGIVKNGFLKRDIVF